MNTKLTLTIEKEVIEIAKEYAKEKGLNISHKSDHVPEFKVFDKLK